MTCRDRPTIPLAPVTLTSMVTLRCSTGSPSSRPSGLQRLRGEVLLGIAVHGTGPPAAFCHSSNAREMKSCYFRQFA